jgi:hypothetical protein
MRKSTSVGHLHCDVAEWLVQFTWGAPTEKSTGYCWLSSTGTPSIALGSSGPSVQAPGATSMQAPGATSVEAQLLFQAEWLMTGSRGTSGSAQVWAI